MAAATPDLPVFRLVYRSHNLVPAPDRKAELGAIFSVSRSGNRERGVTGALLTHGDWFVQTLEGDEGVVRDLYDRIAEDRRHDAVSVIFAERVRDRVFSRWAMAQVSDEGEPDIPLLMNRDRGGASPAAPRRTTPEQEFVLDFMRDVVREGSPVV